MWNWLWRYFAQSCSVKNTLLGISQNSPENTSARLRFATLLKKRLWHGCFPVHFAKFLRNPIFQNTPASILFKFLSWNSFSVKISKIWKNRIRIHSHLVHKRTLNHLVELAWHDNNKIKLSLYSKWGTIRNEKWLPKPFFWKRFHRFYTKKHVTLQIFVALNVLRNVHFFYHEIK